MEISLRNCLIAPLLFLSFLISCQKDSLSETEIKGSEDITTLPMNRISLEDFQEFSNAGDNWTIAANVQSDYQTEKSMEVTDGNGVLVNIPSDEAGENLFTNLEHGDLELKLEFLVPKGSNSGIYFQGRYEVQILDSWLKEEPRFWDVGGIYERWDDLQPEEQRGFEGTAPRVNAGLAPGLWQKYHILFRAPRFNEAGKKVENARFEKVYLNGVLIHENVEVTGPTRAAAFEDERAAGPLMLQGDHGPVAFRNMEYKTYSKTDSITLGEMNFTVYEYEGDRTPEKFDNLKVIAEGTTDHFNVSELSPVNSHYATTFSGKFEVPLTGDYLFETSMRNGGNLYINGELLVENTGEFDFQRLGNIIHLTEGTHQLDVTHFQNIWSTLLNINYEGPNIETRPLVTQGSTNSGGNGSPPLTVQVSSTYPELIGGFFNYKDEKRTHVLSVGHPEGIHYSYDLNNASLLSFWRKPFADVTQMWRGRGIEQLLVPMNTAIESGAGTPLVKLNSSGEFESEWPSPRTGVERYRINENGQPVFHSIYDNIEVEDFIRPANNSNRFLRTLTYRSDQPQDDIFGQLVQAHRIEKLSSRFYRVNGSYYIHIEEGNFQDPEIADRDGSQVLLIPVLRNTDQFNIEYQMIW